MNEKVTRKKPIQRDLKKRKQILKTGITHLDRKSEGILPSELIYLVEKSEHQFAVELAYQLSKRKYKVLFFVPKNCEVNLGFQFLNTISSIPVEKIRSGTLTRSEWERLSGAASFLAKSQIKLIETSISSSAELGNLVRKSVSEIKKLDLVIVTQEAFYPILPGELFANLKSVSEFTRVPILVSEGKPGYENPGIIEIKGTKKVDQYFLYQGGEIYTDHIWVHDNIKSSKGLKSQIRVVKNRRGETGAIRHY